VQWKLSGTQTGPGFSVVHHAIAPHALATPLQRYQNEDEAPILGNAHWGILADNPVTTVLAPGWSNDAISGIRSGIRGMRPA
jgi:hypothetical protein